MSVQVDTAVSSGVSVRRRAQLRSLADRVIEATLRDRGREPGACEVSVLFTEDAFISDLNLQYRGVEGPTDVLSFALSDPDSEVDRVVVPGLPEMLGDVVISLETAGRQAFSAGKTEDQEIALLLVHGVLHLLGFDHDEPEKEAFMWEHQDRILRALQMI